MSDLSQSEADRLLKIAKKAANTSPRSFPAKGGKLEVPLVAETGHETFALNITRSPKIEAKITYQTRTQSIIVLARLDLGAEHRNPDGKRIGSPHLHIYKEDFGDKWAYELPHQDFAMFGEAETLDDWLNRFLDFCKIKHDNIISGGMIV